MCSQSTGEKVMTKTNIHRAMPMAPGAILPDALYTMNEAAARLGWGVHAFRAARDRGLKVHRCGKRGYVAGAELIAFITQSAAPAPAAAGDDIVQRLSRLEEMLRTLCERQLGKDVTDGQ